MAAEPAQPAPREAAAGDNSEPLAKPSPVEAAALLAGLVDVLIPGDADWPSAGSVGVQGILALRLFDGLGRNALAQLSTAILRAGGPIAGRTEADQIAIVKELENSEPALFGWVRDATYIAYYESPFVAAAINAKGHPYELRPHTKGYPLEPFDVERDAPRHGRGSYVATEAVRPVDISGLDLASERTQAWGLKR